MAKFFTKKNAAKQRAGETRYLSTPLSSCSTMSQNGGSRIRAFVIAKAVYVPCFLK
jgi:hypothetical protein